MENLENNELEPIVVPTKKSKPVEPELTDLELQIISRSESLNVPTLCAFFGVTEDVVKAALAKK
jgi:hypothetical protein